MPNAFASMIRPKGGGLKSQIDSVKKQYMEASQTQVANPEQMKAKNQIMGELSKMLSNLEKMTMRSTRMSGGGR